MAENGPKIEENYVEVAILPSRVCAVRLAATGHSLFSGGRFEISNDARVPESNGRTAR